MLQYFPTPYPDELWYSVLCRYHVRSGNSGSAATFRELLGDRDHAALSTFLSNGVIAKIAGQLPETVLDTESIVLNHTLFKYAFRFHPLEVKKDLLISFKMGKAVLPATVSRSYESKELKSCPICVREDREQYGEAYWHLRHQIPYVSICYKHKCLLKSYKVKSTDLNNNFIPLDNQDIPLVEYETDQAKLQLTNMLTCYLELPWELGPTQGYSNLYEGLLNAGYGTPRLDNHYSVDYQRVGRDLCGMFGEERVTEYFGGTEFRAAIFGCVRHWKYKMPERYAMLAVLIGQEPETTFSQMKVENKTDQVFLELSRSKIVRPKKFVMEKLGVSDKQLDIIAHNLGIKPFWECHRREEYPRDCKLALNLTKEEREYVDTCVEKYGFSSASTFIRFCLEKVREKEEFSIIE